ncbi:Na+/H+ antiporter subunit G [Aestuariirhabdus litorea]|uniref:Na+/H+ antiporter subunit G n=1 Tax=Aestuariirhabdus litorea TaxID=2528527 RepID=A0A3P3VM12_9GAMM|nr:Na+/H+ antiporter subunit G [Aestuariirhabdus litorea]RRJ83811.1 Na+/H+ antiporter subunit G [Aestuariirhabdus litorea]RWW97034.1 Na+/H+ antiporter subunit G [Endozoicomonadaceae bacterium GTF-13]
MNTTTEILITSILLLGGTMLLIGSIGLARLPDFYTRLHAPTKATTLGIGSIALASMLDFGLNLDTLTFKEPVIALFLLITAPVTAHMLSKSALHHQLNPVRRTQNQALLERARAQEPPEPSTPQD